MNIRKSQLGNGFSMTVAGRLDSYWAPHFSNELEEVVRAGADDISVDLQQVDFLSSAGIGVLLKYYKLLASIHGAFRVVNPSDAVKSVLELSGLSVMLLNRVTDEQERVTAQEPESRTMESNGMLITTYQSEPPRLIEGEIIGYPGKLEYREFSVNDARPVGFGVHSLGLGIGAFGSTFDDCRNQYGEFLSVAGNSIYLPANRSNVPDFETVRGTYVPQVHVLYGVHCKGDPTSFMRFESTDAIAGVPLSSLVKSFFKIEPADVLVYVLLAETTGLIGAALRQSPAHAGEEGSLFAYPGVRKWLSYTTEPAFAKSLALVVGIVSRVKEHGVQRFLHQFDDEENLTGHAHAAAFTYHHLQKGKLDLQPVVAKVFERETPLGLLHLIKDDRPISGRGESEFIRGVAWLGRLGGGEGSV